MPRVSYAKFLRGWEGLIEKVLANKDDLPHLDTYRAQNRRYTPVPSRESPGK